MGDLDFRVDLRATTGRGAREFIGHASHSTDRDFPFAGLVADNVVEKTAILEEGWIVRMREEANLSIGKNDAAEQIVLNVSFDGASEGFLDEAPPRFSAQIALRELAREILLGAERFEHGIPQLLGENSGEAIEVFELIELAAAPRQFTKGFATGFFGKVAQEEAVMATASGIGRKGRGNAAAEIEIQPEFMNNFLGQEAYEVGVARDFSFVSGEEPLGSCGPADVIVFLEEQDAQPRARQVGSGDEAVVASAENNHVIFCFYFHSKEWNQRNSKSQIPKVREGQMTDAKQRSGLR